MKINKDAIILSLVIVAAIFTIYFTVIIGEEHGTTRELEKIEYLRKVVVSVDPRSAQMVYKEVMETNFRIMHYKRLNKSRMFGWTVSERWNDVHLIDLPALTVEEPHG